jgi:hypothetical protein
MCMYIYTPTHNTHTRTLAHTHTHTLHTKDLQRTPPLSSTTSLCVCERERKGGWRTSWHVCCFKSTIVCIRSCTNHPQTHLGGKNVAGFWESLKKKTGFWKNKKKCSRVYLVGNTGCDPDLPYGQKENKIMDDFRLYYEIQLSWDFSVPLKDSEDIEWIICNSHHNHHANHGVRVLLFLKN